MKEEPQSNLCNEKTFERVYREHVKPLYHFIYYKSGNAQLSEDLAQDAFAVLWQKCREVKTEKARSFLFTVAKNAFLNVVARNKVKLQFEARQSGRSVTEDPAYKLEKKEFQEKLEQAINDLTEAQREVFLLNRIDGFKYREIAELLNISQKAVEKRMHGALKALRKIYDRI